MGKDDVCGGLGNVCVGVVLSQRLMLGTMGWNWNLEVEYGVVVLTISQKFSVEITPIKCVSFFFSGKLMCQDLTLFIHTDTLVMVLLL